jgi:predicted nucleic acid-binding protein
MVVPDTNVFLNLYRYTSATRDDLFAALGSLGSRLWVPHQVLVEFWRNRESALRDPQETGENTIDELEEYCKQSIALLRTWANLLPGQKFFERNLKVASKPALLL